MFGGDHAEIRAALLGRHHGPYFLFGRQPELGLDDPPVGVHSGAFEVGAELQALADAALRVGREGLLDVVHFDAARVVAALPKQPVDEHLRDGRIFKTFAFSKNVAGVAKICC